MVFMKKGATPNKNQQQMKKGKATPSKKVQEDSDQMDDSDEEVPQLQKTPLNKGGKARQSMSEKKVSFSLPGKNSPAAKTPKKENNVAKKAPTPASKGKTALQEFKGMKGKQVQAGLKRKQVQADEDDDDDDDDEDDDFEMDEDDDDIDLEMADEDDDDDDDDVDDEEGGDEDDDEEEDDEEEEEEEDNKSNIKKMVESPKQEKSPKKEKPTAAAKQTNKPASNDKLEGAIIKDDAERRKARNARMLYVGKLPIDVTEQELKGLSKDVIEVTMPMTKRKNPPKAVYAFLTFDTEAKAEANYKSFQSKKFRGQPLTVDYVGEKSAFNKTVESHESFNMKKLFVSGLPVDATIADVAKHFKKAFQIAFNISDTFRTATISFLTPEDAKEAYDGSRDISVGGIKLTVLYSRQSGSAEHVKRRNRGGKNRKNHQNGGQKRIKLSA